MDVSSSYRMLHGSFADVVLPFCGLRLTKNCFRRLAILFTNYIFKLTCKEHELNTQIQSCEAQGIPDQLCATL